MTIVTLLVVGTQLGWGQTSNRGAIAGTILDPIGMVIHAIRVAVTNVDTGATQTVGINARGEYRVDFLLSGNYEIKVEAQGFKKTMISGLVVRVGELLTVDLRLELGSMTQGVTVTSAAGVVNTETASLGEVVPTSAIREISL